MYEDDDDDWDGKVFSTNTWVGRGSSHWPKDDLDSILKAYKEAGPGCYGFSDEDFFFTTDKELALEMGGDGKPINSPAKAVEVWWNDYMSGGFFNEDMSEEDQEIMDFFYRDGKGPKGYETGNYDHPSKWF